MQGEDPVGDRARLGELVAVRRDADLALAVRAERDEPLVGVGTLGRGQRRDDRVGRVQDARPRAEVREQRQPLGGRAVFLREVGAGSRTGSTGDAPRHA